MILGGALIKVRDSPFFTEWDNPVLDWGSGPPVEREEGSHSVVQRMTYAGQPGLARLVTKRIKNEDDTVNEEFFDQLHQEIDAYTRLVSYHPNILRLWCISISPRNEIIFVYPYLEGGTLQDRLNDSDWLNRLTTSAIHTLITQMIAGIAHLHDRKLLHRNIKPAAIFFDKEGVLIIEETLPLSPPCTKLRRRWEL
eukprot:TRINITY_DN16336_c0_g1_i2.p1 TRINITY_DN16336_c0_g1~~TRINITY_DN16336_c0_g1_i2.p1  ORF type:complete len:196 (+),score=17.49 TRINITY_DN16336_c0_g1_i2:551-1138(+)